jgi:hypothetical protein
MYAALYGRSQVILLWEVSQSSSTVAATVAYHDHKNEQKIRFQEADIFSIHGFIYATNVCQLLTID